MVYYSKVSYKIIWQILRNHHNVLTPSHLSTSNASFQIATFGLEDNNMSHMQILLILHNLSSLFAIAGNDNIIIIYDILSSIIVKVNIKLYKNISLYLYMLWIEY